MKKRAEKLLIFCGILGFVVFLTAACTTVIAKEGKPPTKGGMTQEEKSNQCAGCHEMKPQILTWQLSSHSKVACTECHEVDPAQYQGKHDSQSFARPIKIAEAIPDAVCEKCHSANRIATVSGDLVIPHNKHAAAGVSCVKCHSGVVHAKLSEQGLTAKGELSNFENWDLEAAKKVATKYYFQPSMWTCIDCHKQLKITRKCGACHTQIPSLPSHDDPSWSSQHGIAARSNIGDCTKCHVTPGVPKFVTPSTGDLAADFAQAQQFCNKCHLQRPALHKNSMVPIHPAIANEKGIENCLTCHNREKPQPNSKATGTYCNQCHWNK